MSLYMQKYGHETYEEIQDSFSWEQVWDFVDGTPDSINTTHECLDRHRGNGDAVRIKFDDGRAERYTFTELSEGTAQFAHYLEDQGVEKGDRVAIMLNPSYEFMVAFFGVMKRGAVSVPCSELFGPDALEFRLEDSEAEMLVTSAEVAEKIDTGVVDDEVLESETFRESIEGYDTTYEHDTDGEDDAWLLFTSGTTGKPDAYPYQHESTAYWAPVMDFILNWHDGDSAFTTSSTGWGTGIFNGLFGTLLYGVPTGFFSGPFDPELVLEAFHEFDVNVLIGIVPTAYRKMLDAVDDPAAVKEIDRANYVGEPIEEDLSREVEEVFGAFPNAQYGATELRSNVSIDYAYPGYEPRHGSMGKPLPGVDVRIVNEDGEELDPSEIGYIELRRSDEWIRSSDAAYVDEDGYLWSAGRMDDTIISAGYTIGPQEVEEAIRDHSAVVETGVIGAPDNERGEIVKAYVSVDAERTDDLKEELQQFVREELSKHEYPREIDFIDEIPMTPDGKIQRAKLREIEGIT
jgi:acetyl-CoA synthetase